MAPGYDNDTRLTCVIDEERGLRRARAATLFTMSLPGSMYLFQGEELGLPEARDLDPQVRQDPAWHRSGGSDGTRDGCRVPLPWSGASPSYGFNDGSESWLPQPAGWDQVSVASELGVDGSTLELYRSALRARRAENALGEGPLEWLDDPAADVLALRRTAEDGSSVISVINLNNSVVRIPPAWGSTLLVASSDDVAIVSTDDGVSFIAVGPETALWLK
jgi:alpha-glucosidase